MFSSVCRYLCAFRHRDSANVNNDADADVDTDANTLDSTIAYKDTIPFVPPITSGVVVKVYDGDTITIASKLPCQDSPLYRFSVRLAGIDCPEIKGKLATERKCAVLAKAEVSKLCLGKQVTLQNVGTEKYGRILANVYTPDGLHINQYMLEKRLAVAYDGGRKLCPKNWMNYYQQGCK